MMVEAVERMRGAEEDCVCTTSSSFRRVKSVDMERVALFV